jgi:hypothetical protein
VPPDTGSKPASETFSRPTGEKISIKKYSHSHPWDKPAKPPEQTDSLAPQKNTKLNSKQGTEKEHTTEGQGALRAPEKGVEARS